MRVKQLKLFPREPIAPVTRVRCEEEIRVYSEHERQWRVRKYDSDPMRCTRDAAIEIDGKNYCRMHGGHRLIDLALAGKIVVREEEKADDKKS